jgi:hypothetical protein
MALKQEFSGFLIALMVCGGAFGCLGNVQAEGSAPKPAVPEFTAKLISPPVESQSVNRTIELSIKNQMSVSFYNVRMRVNDGSWSLLYPNNNSVPAQSSGEHTILSYLSGHLGVEHQYALGYKAQNLSAGDRVDFQVQAMTGSIHRVYNPNHTSQLDMYPYVLTGETSDWSSTQTITIGGSPEVSPSQSPTPAQSTADSSAFLGLEWVELVMVVLLAAIVVLLGLVVVYLRKRSPK